METRVIGCERMDGSNFSRYGSYVSASARGPDSDCEELRFWNRLGVMDHGGKISVSIVQTYGKNGLVERNLERHSRSTETLIPTDDAIVVVALTDAKHPDVPDLATVKAFHVEKGSAVVLNKDTWHHAPLTLCDSLKTFVMFDESTPDKDFFIIDLPNQYGCEYLVKL